MKVMELKQGGALTPEIVGVSRQAIDRWAQKNRVPYKRLLQIEAVTGVPRHQLAPELFEGYQRIAPLPQSQAMGAETQTSEELRPC